MEPRILIVGRKQAILDALVKELITQGRSVVGTDSLDEAHQLLSSNNIDMVVLGAGLSDDVRTQYRKFIQSLRPNVPIHMKDKLSGPEGMVALVNELVANHQ